LKPVFDAVVRLLKTGDIFAFTVEKTSPDPDSGWKLLPSGRFAHSEEYIRSLVDGQGVGAKIISLQSITPRFENGQPVSGLLVTIVII